jgi:fibronectin-binding autotransporter adhesin
VLSAAEANSARLTQIVKDVKVISGTTIRAANVSEPVDQGSAVRTGSESRAELTFSDLTITRLGANTIFSFNEAARELTLNTGAILVEVPRNSAAVRVNTAAVTGAISGGTSVMNANQAVPTKLFVVEGHGQLCSKKTGECETAGGGEMVMMTVDGHVTKPAQFNTKLLYNTSPLFTDFAPLPNADLIAQVIDQQAAQREFLSGYGASDFSKMLDVLDQHDSAMASSNTTPQPPPPPGTITATFTSLPSGNWSSAASWNPAVVPNNTSSQQYNAIMPNGTLIQDIAGGVTIEQFTMSGGTLILNNPLTLDAGLQFNGGTFSGGTLSIAGPSNQAASMSVNGTIIVNTGIYNVMVDGQPVFSGSGTFNNPGTLVKTTGSGTDTVGITFNNNGLVRAENGTFAIDGGGTGGGAFSAGFNGQISFGNDYIFTNATQFSGPGRISLASGRVFTVSGAITNDAPVALGGEIRINGNTSWSGTGPLLMANGAAIGGSGTFTNASTIEGAGSMGMNQIGIANQNGGLIDANTEHGLLILQPDQTGLSNQGTLRASNGAVLLLSGLGGASFDNTGGTITAVSAEVQLSSGAAITGGTLNSSGGGVIRTLNAASLNSVTNAGAFLIDDGAATTLIGTLTNTGSISLNSATNASDLILNGDVTLSGGGTINFTSSARLRGSGILTNVDNILQGDTRNLGSIGNGEIGIINHVNGVIDANVATFPLQVNPSSAGLDNAGIMRAANGGILVLSGGGGGSFHNTGTVEAVNGGAIHLTAALTSSGAVDIANNTMTISDPGSYTQTAGMFTLAGGTVNSASVLNFQGGIIDAYGTINASIDNNAILKAALGGNGLALNGNLRLLGSSHLTLQLGGLSQGNQYSFINVRGTVALAGTLVVSFANGFQNSISNSDTFTVLASTSNLSGSFANVASGGRVATSDNSGSFLVNDSGNTVTLSNFLPASFNSNVVFNGLPNGLWSEPASWTPMVVPNNAGGQAFNASMSSGMLTQDIGGGVTIQNFNMSGGTLTLSNALTLNAGLTYSGGTINGGNLNAAGASTLDAPLTTSTGLTINNSGTFSLNFDNSNAFAGSSVTFNNSGTVQKAVGNGTIVFNASLNNAGGTMLAQNGTLQFASGGNLAGTFSADAGASIQFSNSFAFADGSAFTGAGTIMTDNASTTSFAGTIVNNATVLLNSTGSFTDVNLGGNNVTLTGTGTLRLQNADRVLGGGTLTNQSTIAGETSNGGGLGYDGINIINGASGVINADIAGKTLTVDPNTNAGLTNNGLMEASSGGILLLSGNQGGAFTNNSTITAQNGSEVHLTAGADLIDGTLQSVGNGVVRNLDSATLDSLTLAGNFVGNNSSTTFLSGTITNNGSILIQSTGSFTDINLHSTSVTLQGSGTVTLQNADRILGGGTLFNQSTIAGETSNGGGLGYDGINIVNDTGGVIDANVGGLALVVDPNASAGLINKGLMQATNGGILVLSGNQGGAFTNNTVIAAEDASEVQLTAGADLIDGTLQTAGSGVIRNLDSATLDSLTVAGRFVGNNASTTFLSGTITNNGAMLLNSTGSFTDVNLHSTIVTLAGTGTLTLQNADRVLGGGTLINQSTIEGETSNGGGLGYDGIDIVNGTKGVINANVSGKALVLDPNANAGLTNNGVLEASNGGILVLTGNQNGVFTNNTSITAQNGSEVQLTAGADLIDGTLQSVGNGVVRNLDNATLDSLTLAGNFVGNNSSTTFLSGTITNNGSILIQSTGSFTDINLHSTSVTLQGSGTVTLQNADRILGGGTLFNQSTIAGETSNGGGLGYDGINIVNDTGGVIDANVGGLALVVDPNASAGLINKGLMQATNGGILVLSGNQGGDFNNNNVILAEAGSEVQLSNGANVTGGQLLTSGGSGVIRNVNSATLKDVTIDSGSTVGGGFVANNATTTTLVHAITNRDSILLNSTGSFTDLGLSGNVNLDGFGALLLQNADRVLGSGTLTTNNLIEGETNNGGSLGADQIGIVNNGQISANVNGLALNVDPNSSNGLTNNGSMVAQNGGILLLNGNNGGAFTNNANIIAGVGAADQAEVQLTNGAFVTGGAFFTTDTGHIRNLNTATLADLSINGNFVANNATTTTLAGRITNNGSMLINSTGSFTDVSLNGNLILAGTGALTLQNADRVLGNGVLSNGSTIRGETNNGGSLGADQIGIAIAGAGVINANASGLTLNIDPRPADGLTNAGELDASNSGILLLNGNNGGSFINNNIIRATGGGVINLTGTLTSGTTAVLDLQGGTFLDNGNADVNQVTGTAGTINVAGSANFSAVSDFDFSGDTNGVTNGGTLDFTAPAVSFGQSAGEVNGANFDGADAPAGSNAPGGDGGTLKVTATAGDVNVGQTQLLASTGLNGSANMTGGSGGTVNLTAAAAAVNIDGKIQVSDNAGNRKSARGGNINVTSGKTSGVAINISSSGQLLSLLNAAAPGPGGKITVLASAASGNNSSINVSGTIQADRGGVDIRHAGDAGTVTLNNATLSGDIVKTAALGSNGTLTIGGGSISADTVLKLYAAGSNGTINFIASVSLNGASTKTIAANTVNIFDNVTVTIGGGKRADVFTNNANYTGSGGNGSRKGIFGGAGATTDPKGLAGAPPLGPPGGP